MELLQSFLRRFELREVINTYKKLIIFLVILFIIASFSYGIGYGFGTYLGEDLTQQLEQLKEEQEYLRGPINAK